MEESSWRSHLIWETSGRHLEASRRLSGATWSHLVPSGAIWAMWAWGDKKATKIHCVFMYLSTRPGISCESGASDPHDHMCFYSKRCKSYIKMLVLLSVFEGQVHIYRENTVKRARRQRGRAAGPSKALLPTPPGPPTD